MQGEKEGSAGLVYCRSCREIAIKGFFIVCVMYLLIIHQKS